MRYGHTGAALAAGEGDLGALRQRQELEADCYAARTLGESAQPSDAALRFFTRMGPFRFDAWHPSGAQRAAKILACLPAGRTVRRIRRIPRPGANNFVGRATPAPRRSTPRPTNPSTVHGFGGESAAKDSVAKRLHLPNRDARAPAEVLTSPPVSLG